MRNRPFLQANESPRPYSEIRAEREANDPDARQRASVMAHIAMLEAEAKGCSIEVERRLLQCEAEALRCALSRR